MTRVIDDVRRLVGPDDPAPVEAPDLSLLRLRVLERLDEALVVAESGHVGLRSAGRNLRQTSARRLGLVVVTVTVLAAAVVLARSASTNQADQTSTESLGPAVLELPLDRPAGAALAELAELAAARGLAPLAGDGYWYRSQARWDLVPESDALSNGMQLQLSELWRDSNGDRFGLEAVAVAVPPQFIQLELHPGGQRVLLGDQVPASLAPVPIAGASERGQATSRGSIGQLEQRCASGSVKRQLEHRGPQQLGPGPVGFVGRGAASQDDCGRQHRDGHRRQPQAARRRVAAVPVGGLQRNAPRLSDPGRLVETIEHPEAQRRQIRRLDGRRIIGSEKAADVIDHPGHGTTPCDGYPRSCTGRSGTSLGSN